MGNAVIIFLDANIIIYQVEAVPAFRDQVRSVIDDIVAAYPGSRFAASRLSILECLVKPVREQNTPLIERYRTFFSARDLTVIEISPAVIELALGIRAAIGLRTPDAIQASSALSLSEPAIFVSGDAVFAKVAGLSSRIIS